MACLILLMLFWTLAEQTTVISVKLPETTENHRRSNWNPEFWNETFSIEKSEKYPDFQIESLLKTMFRQKKINKRNHGIKYRNGENNKYEYIQECDFEPIVEPIYEIIDNKGQIRYVVQNEKYFMQTLVLQKCSKLGKITQPKNFNLEEQSTFDLFCDEKRIHYKFLVLSEDGKYFEMVSVLNDLPISCYCRMEIRNTPTSN